MKLRNATVDDAQLLAEMNRRLIEDEGHRNPMSISQLVQRMRDFLNGEYTATIFENGSEALGYALFRPQEDSIDLRQFFIERPVRRKGLGRAALGLLIEQVFPAGKRVVASVLATNPGGLEFWKAVGFDDYCTTLEFRPRKPGE